MKKKTDLIHLVSTVVDTELVDVESMQVQIHEFKKKSIGDLRL